MHDQERSTFVVKSTGLYPCVGVESGDVPAVGLIVTCRRALKCLISALALSAGARMEVSSLGFCGGWFTWCRWLLVVVVPGGGCRVPGRLCARWGCACRWRSVAGWCPPSGPTRRWRARVVSMSCQGPWLRISSVLYKELECLGQGEAGRGRPWNPPRRLPRPRIGLARSE